MGIAVIWGLAAAGFIALVFGLRKKWGRKRHCAQCGGRGIHGYSKIAESDPHDIVPVCTPCLLTLLLEDYRNYKHRAVVVQPVAELPCYVFRPKSEWDGALQKELELILKNFDGTCTSCGRSARYRWLDCDLDAKIVADLPEKGLDGTLRTNLREYPISLCEECSIKRIAAVLNVQELRYKEICGPRGTEDGMVVAMGY